MVDRLSNLRSIFSVFVLTLLICNPLWADDIEIFFGRTSSTDMQSNVLFILDGSRSMNMYDCKDIPARYTPCNDGTASGSTTRLARMKAALKDVLNNTSNINAGLMRFSHTDSGGRVTYPIRPIDQQLCGDHPCDQERVFTARSRIASSNDDATQRSDGAVVIDESEIAISTIPDLSVTNTWVGLRFPDMDIPQGATITDARLDFTSTHENDNTSTVTIYGEASGDASTYTTAYNNISARSRTANPVSWSLPDWIDTGNYESPDISALIQPIVSQSGWCGGHALGIVLQGTGERYFSSFDNGAGNAPSLTVSYTLDDVQPETGGCTKSTLLTRVTSPLDDATEIYNTWPRYTTTNSTVLSVKKSSGWGWASWGANSQISGVRFAEINIPKNATILNASLTLVTSNTGSPSNMNIKIRAENNANPPPFSNWRGNIRNRNTTSSVTWNNVATTRNTETTSPPLTSIVQSLVNKGSWSSGNPMVFILKEDGSGEHQFVSFDSNPSKAALLKIEFESRISSTSTEVEGPVTDVRSKIIQEIDAMVANSGTPSVGALLEAKNYFTGQNVDYGKNRAAHYGENHPYGWYDAPYGRYSRVSTPESYTGGTVVREPGCTDNSLNSAHCDSEHITGTPVYISPFADECQTNHIVLLTDGQPNDDSTAAGKVQSLIGGTCETQEKNEGNCGEELATYLNTTDLDSMGGNQNITTHTIGFNFTNQWLQDVASAGGGGFYNADSASELSAALANIIDSMQDTNTSFVAPGATVDNFSRVSHRNDIYLALFQPKSTPGWVGNLKRFDFLGNPAKLVDMNEAAAVDPETGGFYETSKSYWAEVADDPDGDDVSKGGAANRQDPATRKVYTYRGTADLLTHESNEFSAANITKNQLGVSSAAAAENLIDWALGFDVKDSDGDGSTDDARSHLGDPLHSQPVIVTYGGSSDNPDSVIYFGTNDGFLHAIATDDGEEIFSFIPAELIPNLKPLYDNNPATGKIYGLDGAMSLWVDDQDNDGSITGTEKVSLFAGMRRGGRNYYALDVSDKDSPQFKWQITGGETDFEELGQTWSQAVPTKINYNGTDTEVLIFGGGYDSTQDNKQSRNPDNIGRALYIVNADDGTLLWSGGPTNNETTTFEDMIYSFPASPKVIDLNGDGNTDQIYIGDMGGRIWRFDINSTTSLDLVEGGIIADLGEDGIMADARRFYHTPDISVSQINGEQYINIAIGSGYQAHPLDTTIEDNFYLIRYPSQPNADNHYGIPVAIAAPDTGDTEGDDVSVEEEEFEVSVPTVEYLPITEDDLFDATSNVLGEGTAAETHAAETELAASHGWFINMERNGEKVLGSSVTFDNKILFASYVPGRSISTGCSPEIGYGVFWAVNLWDATPVTSHDPEHVGALTKVHRNTDIPGGGIPAPIQTLFIESGDLADGSDKQLQVLAISGAISLMTLSTQDLVQRVYWSEYPNF